MDIIYAKGFENLKPVFKDLGVVQEGAFTLPDGSVTNKFIDTRNAIINPQIMYDIGYKFQDVFSSKDVSLLVPTSSAGLLFAVGLNTAIHSLQAINSPYTPEYRILPVRRDDITIWPIVPEKPAVKDSVVYLIESFGSRGTSIWSRKVATALRNRGCRIAGMLILVAEAEEMEAFRTKVTPNVVAICQVGEEV